MEEILPPLWFFTVRVKPARIQAFGKSFQNFSSRKKIQWSQELDSMIVVGPFQL